MIFIIAALSAAVLFFSVSTIALRTFSHARLRDACRRRGKEELTEELIENSDWLILSCGFYRLIFNLGLLVAFLFLFGGREAELSASAYVFSFVFAMLIHAVFGLAVPHWWAKYSGEAMLSYLHGPLKFLAMMIWPLVYGLDSYEGLVRRLAGIPQPTAEEQQEEKQEEFLNGLEQHQMEGVVDKEEKRMIERVLRLNETTADEIMTPRTDIVAVEPTSGREEILDTIIKAGHSRVPVFKENIDNIIGFVYAKDLLTEIGRKPEEFKLGTVLRKAYFVPETKPLRELLHEFQNQKLHIAVVLDEYGGTAGIVTIEDILEELVGEITDEYEEIPPEPVRKIDENTLEVDARTDIDDLNDQYNVNLPAEEDYDTVGGFVLSQMGRIPKTGETFDYGNKKFTIGLAETRKIKRVRIQINREQPAE
jgi:CBS domain containing-hemolysin-like protein